MGSENLIFGEYASEVRDKIQPEGTNGTRYIGLEHIKQGTLHLNSYGSANDVSSTKSKFSKGDILFGKLRPYFRKAIRAPFDGVCSTDIWVIRFTNGICQGFLYYWMASQEFVDFSMQGSEGTKMPRAKWNHVSRHQIPSFTENEQRTISHILGSLDDKIELNRRMNETLEAMAQGLFKSWFVDFAPVIDKALAAGNEIPEELRAKAERCQMQKDKRRPVCSGRPLPGDVEKLFPAEFEYTVQMGWIPRGWETQALYDIATFINGAAYKNFHFIDDPAALPVVKIAEIKKGLSDQTKFMKTELDDGDILFSWSGNPDTSIDTFVWTGSPGWLNQHIFKVSLKDDVDRNFVCYQLKILRPYFSEIARNKQTTGLGHVTVQDMKRMYVTSCSPSILSAFNTHAGSLFDKWYSNLLSIKNQSNLRDTLLPKFLSGDIWIPEAVKLVGNLNRNGGWNGKS